MFKKSEELLKQAETIIPLGTMTFSKSKTQYPKGVSPFYAESGKGCILTDVDGNEYIDWSMGLCSTLIGYADPRINRAVKKQLEKGSIFSLATELEIEVSKKIIDMVPCAEMVRFGKNGSDATTGAIRLAREYTGRKYIIKFVGHYHGYHSWSIYHVNPLGIPEEETSLTLLAKYNDLESVQRLFDSYPDQIAAVIMEPMNLEYPKDNFLHEVQDLARANGALFILDEVIAGFRFARGGAQEAFDIVPDLACLGKGLANGFPLSALVGRADIMQLLEKIHFSFTFGGDCVALASANACLDILKNTDYGLYLLQGLRLMYEIDALLDKYKLTNHIDIKGSPSWSVFTFKDLTVKTLFLQECFKRNILTTGSHNLSFSHKREHVDKTIRAYDEIFALISNLIHYHSNINDFLDCEPLKPLFKVR